MYTRVLQALVFGLIFTIGTWFLTELDAFEWLHQYSRDHEDWELDEIIIGSIVGVFTLLLWFVIEVFNSHSSLRVKIQELEQAREGTKAAEHLLDQAYRTSPALFTISRLSDGKFIRTNDAWTFITGYTENDIYDRSDLDLGLWQNPQDREYFVLLTYAQKSLRNYEAVFITKPGNEKHMLLSGEIVQYGGEDCLLMVGMDISERFEIEQTKNQFISVVSHELRTPLTSIQGSLKLMLGGTCGILSEKAIDLLRVCERNSVRLLDMVDDILDLEKLRAGSLIYDMQRIALDTVIDDALKSNQSFAEHYDVRLISQTDVTDAMINGDHKRLVQVMSNLISNGAKASTPGGQINIHLQRDGDIYRTLVTDFGSGIPEDYQANIFHSFTQADSSDVRKEQGTGMGLAICKAIIQQHGGEIGFESTPGVGTTFYFTLPAL